VIVLKRMIIQARGSFGNCRIPKVPSAQSPK
jgi:hypothetical protein